MAEIKGIVSPKELQELNDNYTSRWELITRDITKQDDNRSSWWSLEDLRAYLDYAENQAKELGYTMNGIRVYSGAYPEVDGQPGYTTAFIVPTADIPEGKDGGGSGNNDIGDADGFNGGGNGKPPGANYPQ
ncbi:hypothetical protein [Pontimicrobium sp. IMCC45349]|uniref:hypothetical protein n=1 Tax=Pontimicrobium sp. IMCC45349 TaxID=3391574 RepID=UPI0039A32AFB